MSTPQEKHSIFIMKLQVPGHEYMDKSCKEISTNAQKKKKWETCYWKVSLVIPPKITPKFDFHNVAGTYHNGHERHFHEKSSSGPFDSILWTRWQQILV